MNTIIAKQVHDARAQEELAAAAVITPGFLVEITSAGTVQAHSTAGGNAAPAKFAIEDSIQGNDITDNYAATNKVQVWTPQKGDWVYAILSDGENVSIGTELESAGDGALQEHSVDSEGETNQGDQIVGIAREAKDLSDSSGAESSAATIGYDKRILIEIV